MGAVDGGRYFPGQIGAIGGSSIMFAMEEFAHLQKLRDRTLDKDKADKQTAIQNVCRNECMRRVK